MPASSAFCSGLLAHFALLHPEQIRQRSDSELVAVPCLYDCSNVQCNVQVAGVDLLPVRAGASRVCLLHCLNGCFRLSRASSKFARTREGYGEGRYSSCMRAIIQSAVLSAALKRPFLVPPAVLRASCLSTGAGVSTMLEKTSLGEFPVYYGGAAKPDRPGVIVLQVQCPPLSSPWAAHVDICP